MKLVAAQLGICCFEVIQRAQFLWFFDRGGVIMYCERHGVFSKNFVLRFANLNSYFSLIINSYIENNPEMSGFWCVAKA